MCNQIPKFSQINKTTIDNKILKTNGSVFRLIFGSVALLTLIVSNWSCSDESPLLGITFIYFKF